MVMSYERVQIRGCHYLLCADCRKPLLTGHNPLYWVPQVRQPVAPSNSKSKQAVCSDCYLRQWSIVQPDDEAPDLPDVCVPGEPPVPRGTKVIQEEYDSDFAMWEAAVIQARASNGAEKVEDAYRRISSAHAVDVEISAPPSIPETKKEDS